MILGVRHHGPGSARAVRAALEEMKPDAVLIEGPPEANELLPLAADPDMEPPVALLAYVPGEPSRSAFWPFAVFSPEWQAILYALEAGVPVRMCDLPASATLAQDREKAPGVRQDPLGWLAEAAGYDDAERWWEDVVEHRSGAAPFEAVAEAMTALREQVTEQPGEREARREAYMRRTLRQTRKEGYERIAVVCGAWHVPALREMPTAASDDRLLRGLPKTRVSVTWVPWTHGRLASWSGYGAGVRSPGWYHHLFAAPDRPVERWLSQAAAVLRDEDLPVSSAHVIESVRLAETLATLRGRPLAGLEEVTEATRAVLCEGAELPVELIQRRLVVGERLGQVPPATPMVPLQRDVRAQQRSLKMKVSALETDHDLDLRKPIGLGRSRLLHRLGLIGVGWGTQRRASGKGTFRESWTLAWRPELDVDLIEASAWGTTVESAATARACQLAGVPAPAASSAAGSDVSLAELTTLTERCLLADLPDALPVVMRAVGERAALDTDVSHLMGALPPLVRAARYGDVRGTDCSALRAVIAELAVRIRIGLPAVLNGLDDDAARELVNHVNEVHAGLGLLDDREHLDGWLATLESVVSRDSVHGLVEGRCTRLLLDAGRFDDSAVSVRMSRAVSIGTPPARAAAWVEGFLSGSGLLLVHNDALLRLVDEWITGLPDGTFGDVLPLLRRTFGEFDPPERRSIGERVRNLESGRPAGHAALDDIDEKRAAAAVQTVELILGIVVEDGERKAGRTGAAEPGGAHG